MLAFASMPVLAGAIAMRAAWQSRRSAAGDPWGQVDVSALGGEP
jgi:hypothetical protein